MFLSKLAAPGSLLFHKDTGIANGKLVLAATTKGVVCWPVLLASIDNQRSLKLDTRKDATWSYVHITDPTDWLCQLAAPVPPALLKDCRPDDGRPCGIRLVITDNKVYTIVKACALTGLDGWTCAEMKDLVRYFDVPCDGGIPTLEKDLATLLIKYLLPGIDEVKFAELMGLRSFKNKKLPFHSVCANPGAEGLVEDCIDHDSRQELLEQAAKYAKHVEALKVSALPKAKAKAKGRAMKKKKCGAKDLEMIEACRKYLPDALGCAISNETEWHTRFKITYPTLTLPDQTSACYEEDDPKSKRFAIVFCLSWAWEEHERLNPGETCPWDLSL